MEDLLRVLDDYPGDSTADSEKTDKGRRSPASKRDQERNEAARGEPKNAHGFSVEKERGTCGGSVVNEVAVVRAHVVEAGVGLCCLRPAERSNDSTAGREDNLKRLTVWLKRCGIVRYSIGYFVSVVACMMLRCYQTSSLAARGFFLLSFDTLLYFRSIYALHSCRYP